MKNEKILYLDDEIENVRTLQRILFGKYELATFTDPLEAVKACENSHFELIITDQRMPNLTGIEFLKKVLHLHQSSLGIVITAYSDQDAMVEGVNHELLFRYITKPIKEADLLNAIVQAKEKIKLVKENEQLIQQLKEYNIYLEKEVGSKQNVEITLSKYPGFTETSKLIQKVAPSQSTVLIRGESGSGKEVVARNIHQFSTRKSKPFIRVNCGSITESLLESELFGHEKGAFTGATSAHMGKFEAASGGTLFLDEIGDISPKLQVSLLRVIQEKQLERVGGNKTIDVDVRILAATHQNLEDMVAKKQFREDLFYRLNVFPIQVPPLRDRMIDIDLLLPILMEKVSQRSGMRSKKLSASAVTKIKAYDWPGNIRELENMLERALILSTEVSIESEDILIPDTSELTDAHTSEQELTYELLHKTLQDANGNKVEAARRLNIKRPTLYYHLRRLGISS